MAVLLGRNVIKIYAEKLTTFVLLVDDGEETWPGRDIRVLLLAPRWGAAAQNKGASGSFSWFS